MKPKFYWSDRDDCYLAIVPNLQELKYLLAFGDAEQAALNEFAIVLESVRGIYQEDGMAWPLDGQPITGEGQPWEPQP